MINEYETKGFWQREIKREKKRQTNHNARTIDLEMSELKVVLLSYGRLHIVRRNSRLDAHIGEEYAIAP